jgi:hypothetical protein
MTVRSLVFDCCDVSGPKIVSVVLARRWNILYLINRDTHHAEIATPMVGLKPASPQLKNPLKQISLFEKTTSTWGK